MGWQHQPARRAQERGGGVFTIPGKPGPESAGGVTPPFSAQVSQEQSSSKGSEDSWSRGGDWVCVGQAVPLTGHSSVVSLSTCLPLPPELAGPQRLRTDSPFLHQDRRRLGHWPQGLCPYLSRASSTPGLLGPRQVCTGFILNSRQKSISAHTPEWLPETWLRAEVEEPPWACKGGL